MESRENRPEFLAQVASLYYDKNKTQQEIAQVFGITRSAISRLLSEAREKGIVEIVVHYPLRTATDLEVELQSAFNLKDVCVLLRENKTHQENLAGMGRLAAQYFSGIVTPTSVVGISWGTSLYNTVQAIHPDALPDVEIIQLIGGTGSEKGSAIGPLLAPMLANKLGCTCRYVHAPLLTETLTARDILMQEPSIRDTLERANNADIALVGIGAIDPEIYNPHLLGYVSDEELDVMRAAGIVGDICFQHFTIDGEVPDIDINRRAIGINTETLSKIRTVIGVAGGARKGEAIYGALMGGFVDVLITDDQAAKKVLALKKMDSVPA